MANSKLKIENIKLPSPLPLQPEEEDLLSRRKRLSVSQWAEKYRRLSAKTTNLAGDWSNDYCPYLIEIMDSLSDIGTREVWVQKCAQSAGTEAGLNFLGQTVCEDPAPMLIAMPTEDIAKKRLRTRIKPMFEATPQLIAHLPDEDIDNLNIGQETVLDNMILFIAWSNSAAALSDMPICKVIADEAAKFSEGVGAEAGSYDLLRDRMTTFFARSKLYAPSTPVLKNDMFDVEFCETDMRNDWIRCIRCGQRHIPKWAYVEMQKTSDRKLLSHKDYLLGDCAHYVCPHCEAVWSERDRWAAVCSGIWAPAGCTVDVDGKICGKVFSNPHKGFQISGMMLYPGFMTIGRLAGEWAKAQTAKNSGNIKPLQNFINSRLGEPFEEREKETDENKLVIHIGNYAPGVVPAGVQILSAGIDVQLDHFWVWVLGWGWMSEVWSIFEQRIESGDTKDLENYQPLREFLSMTWPMATAPDKKMAIRKAAIDCNYRPDIVLDFCRQVTEVDIIPVRGDDTVRSRVFRAVKVAGGTMIRYDLNVNILKDRLYRLLYDSTAPGPGYFHLHKETTSEVLKHLSAEEQRRIRTRRRIEVMWVKKDSHLPNHLWDCGMMATFAAELAGARTLRDPSEPLLIKRRQIGMLNRLK